MKKVLVLSVILAVIVGYMGAVWAFVPTESHSVVFSEHSSLVFMLKRTLPTEIPKIIYKPALIALTLGAVLAIVLAFIKKLPSWVRLTIQVIVPAAVVFAYDVFKLKRIFGVPHLDYAAHTIVLHADMEDLYLKYMQISAFDVLFAIAGALAVAIICELIRTAVFKVK